MGFTVEDFTMKFHRAGHPVITYVAHDEDVTGAGSIAAPHYYGYVTASGAWVIMERVIGTSGRMRYAFGRSDYETAWAARAGKTYATVDTATPEA